MRAARITSTDGPRSVQIEEIGEPVAGPGQILIDVEAAGVNFPDLLMSRNLYQYKPELPFVMGGELAGTVREAQPGSGFAPGDRVVVRPLAHCGECPACQAGYTHICHRLKFLGLDTDGALQEKWNVPAHTLHKLPQGMSLETAAMIEPLAVAVHDVRRARLQAGETALVIGGGPIGMLIAMVAKHVGASVILSEINPNRLKMAAEMGFTGLNPREGDVAAEVNEITGTKGADVVFEVSGTQPGVDLMTAAAATRGRICMVAIHAQKAHVDLFRFFWRELEMVGARVYEAVDYDQAIQMIADGLDVNRLITDRHPLASVQQAFEALDGNATAMKTLIKIGEPA